MENLSVEIVNSKQRYVAESQIIKFYPSSKTLYTNIPRGNDGIPIPLSPTTIYNLAFSTVDSILFFKVKFTVITLLEERPCYLFSVLDHKFVPNLRVNQRKSVEFQAVASDFNTSTVVTILDISSTGARIKSHKKIISQFVELFFDKSNDSLSVDCEIKWEKFNEPSDTYYYGVDFRKR